VAVWYIFALDTAKANGIDEFVYLYKTLEKIHTTSIAELLSFKRPDVSAYVQKTIFVLVEWFIQHFMSALYRRTFHQEAQT
jgi:hypothetical protein